MKRLCARAALGSAPALDRPGSPADRPREAFQSRSQIGSEGGSAPERAGPTPQMCWLLGRGWSPADAALGAGPASFDLDFWGGYSCAVVDGATQARDLWSSPCRN